MGTSNDSNYVDNQKKSADELAEPTYPGQVFSPAVDIFETKEAITVVADMPGVKPENLSISLEDNVLTVSGRVEEAEKHDEKMVLQEYMVGSYYRRFALSNLIDQEKIDASLSDGVVRIALPKADQQAPRQISIQTD